MPALFIYLIKVNIALLIFCAGYYLVLRRLTFYTLNRIYLASAILFASVYPQISLSGFLEHHQQIAKPVQAVVFDFQTPVNLLVKPLAQPTYWQWAGVVFWAGVALFAIRLLIQFISLFAIYRKSSAAQLHGYKVRIIKGDGGPFSFWKNIYINPDQHQPADLEPILRHEHIHVSEWHTLDILLAEISAIFYWFNPGIWLMKKAIRENVEFITDRKILNNGIDTRQYQYSLVNVSFAASPQGIVNHFNISTIKKRIIMMNAKRSSKIKLTRYALLVPVIVVLLLVFTISRAAYIKKSARFIKTVIAGSPAKLSAKTLNTTPITAPAKLSKAKKLHGTIALKAQPVKPLLLDTPKKATGQIKKLTIEPSMYIVDGVITKDYDINKVDSKNIVSINIGRLDTNGKAIVYVHTKNGMESQQSPAKVWINYKPAKNLDGVVVDGHLSYIDTVRLNGRSQLDTVFIAHLFKARTNTGVRSKLVTTSRPYAMASNFKVYSSDGDRFSLSNLSNKMVVIDGSVASESDLKKLSAFDIDRVVYKTDKETEELYGDKAKDGIVFILTKKGK